MVIVKKAIENDVQIQKVSKLLEELEINFQDISTYILAFIHRSIVNEKPDFAPEHNERLEFLWDAVLELVITSNLFTMICWLFIALKLRRKIWRKKQ